MRLISSSICSIALKLSWYLSLENIFKRSLVGGNHITTVLILTISQWEQSVCSVIVCEGSRLLPIGAIFVHIEYNFFETKQ